MKLPESLRLSFRCWSEEDFPLAMSLWTDPDVMRYMGGPMDEDGVRARLKVEMDRQARLGVQYWPIFLRESGDFAGCAGLRPFHDEERVWEVGVHIRRSYWSGRLGEEAARAVIAYGFGELGARALTAGHGPGHANSKAMIERLGFVFTHEEPWGAKGILHPFYRMERPGFGVRV